jgi:hypothetical protein
MPRNESEGLKVMVRVRPPISTEVKLKNVVLASGGQSVNIQNGKTDITCAYDRVFSENCEQSEVFEVMKPLLQDVLKGVNGTIFAYGQTSAGKSHSMLGPNGGADIMKTPRSKWGLLPRASEFLLTTLSEQENAGELTYNVKASFLQIYNETVYDLLRGSELDRRFKEEEKQEIDGNSGDDLFKSSTFQGLKIRELPRAKNYDGTSSSSSTRIEPQEVYVAGLSEYRVTSAEDVLHLVSAGTSNRAMRSTDFNATSSRSHAVLQLSLEIESRTRSGETVISRSKLSLADLAGSEKILTNIEVPVGTEQKENEYVKTRHLRELTSINTSLSCLGNVISALTNKSRSHIPYRDSKLTRLLQDSLGGNTRTILLACIAPTDMHTTESVNTLQFADRAKGVMLKVKANTVIDDKAALARANSEITRLQNLLANALAKLEGKGAMSPNPSKPSESHEESNEEFIMGGGSSIDFYIKENARLREEVFELRSMFGSPSSKHQKGNFISKQNQREAKASEKQYQYQQQRQQHQPEQNHLPEFDRSKENDLQRVNRKQRRRNRNNKKNINDAFDDEKDNSRLVSRFKQASKNDSNALSNSGNAKIYGSTVSLKTISKRRNSFDEDTNEFGDGDTNKEYFNGFLSSIDPSDVIKDSKQPKNEKINVYLKDSTTKTQQSKSARRSGSGNKKNGNTKNTSSTSPSRMRLDAERTGLEQAYKEAQNELSSEMNILNSLTAQRMSLERQLNEQNITHTSNNANDNSGQNNIESIFVNSDECLSDVSSPMKSDGLYIDADLSDENYDSQDFVPLTLDGTTLDDIPPNTINNEGANKENAENVARSLPIQSPTRSVSEIFNKQRHQDPISRAAVLRENVQIASKSQAIPSPTKVVFNVNNEETSNALNSNKIVKNDSDPESTETGLYYDSNDSGRKFQQFSFRHNDWIDMQIHSYDEISGMHIIASLGDGKTQNVNLRKKPIRLI